VRNTPTDDAYEADAILESELLESLDLLEQCRWAAHPRPRLVALAALVRRPYVDGYTQILHGTRKFSHNHERNDFVWATRTMNEKNTFFKDWQHHERFVTAVPPVGPGGGS